MELAAFERRPHPGTLRAKTPPRHQDPEAGDRGRLANAPNQAIGCSVSCLRSRSSRLARAPLYRVGGDRLEVRALVIEAPDVLGTTRRHRIEDRFLSRQAGVIGAAA